MAKLGGAIKTEPEDFVVEEIPAYLPCGTGEHLYLWVQKRNLSAEQLIAHVARTLGVSRNDLGMAGLKDRLAVTRQWISVPAARAEERLSDLENESVQILQTARHTNKLRTGHLRGNRFQILVRNPGTGALETAERIADQVRQRGVPNLFGDQRFGHDQQTLELGRSLLKGESFPKQIPFHRRKFLARLALSAVQSDLFNRVVRRRSEEGLLHQVLPGDVMQIVSSGATFLVDDVRTEQARFDQKEIVPTGPMFGPKMKRPEGAVQEMEEQVLIETGLTHDDFSRQAKLTPGGRRPLLIFPEGLQVRPDERGIWLEFTLPAGAYATVVMNEFIAGEHSSTVSEDHTEES